LLSPLWIAPAVALLGAGWPSAWDSPVHSFYLVLSALFWIGHRFSSTWMAWMSSAYRPLLRAQPMRFVVVPVLAVWGIFAVVLDPAELLPGTPLLRAAALGAVDYLLVTWHFAAQHFGLLSLYRARSGRGGEPGLRRRDRIFAVGFGGGMVLLAEVARGLTAVPDAWLPAALRWSAVVTWAPAALWVGGATTALVTAALVALELRAGPRSRPRALYVAGLGGAVLSAFFLDPFLFLALWTIPHWLSAMALASVVVSGEPAPPRGARWHRLFHGVNRSAPRWLLAVALVGLVVTPLFEVEVAGGPDDRPMVHALGPTIEAAMTGPVWLPWLLALGLATGLLHYLLDRAVWRLSDPLVRQATAPLLRGPVRGR
jgi:hypothetical protein